MNPTDQEIYDYLTKDKGLSHNHAMGMLNNIKHESNNNPGVKGDYMIADPSGNLKNKERLVHQKSDGTWYYSRFHPTKARQDVEAEHLDNINATSGGLFQHQGSRNSAMKEYVGDDWETDWKGQIDFALQEPDTKKYLDKDFDTPEEASTDFTVNWERPADSTNVAQTRVDTIGNINITPITITESEYDPNADPSLISEVTIQDRGVAGTYDDWSEIERGDHEDGDIIKVGDKHYEYQDDRRAYAPHDIETGETQDLWDHEGGLIWSDQLGTNPERLQDGSKNPKYRDNRNEDGSYIYNTIQDVKKDKKKLQEGDVIIVDGKEYRYDSEANDLISFDANGNIVEEGNINVNNITAETTTEVVEKAEVKGTYNDWTEIEKGDVLDGEVIKVGDDFYQYQGSSTYYIPYDIETGEAEEAVDRGQYVSDRQIGTNPEMLRDGSWNPDYKEEEEYPEVTNKMIDDGFTGKGKITHSDGTVDEGDFHEGNFSYGSRTLPNGDIIQGAFEHSGDRHGKRVLRDDKDIEITYANGDVYKGSHTEGKPTGGTMTRSDGEVINNYTSTTEVETTEEEEYTEITYEERTGGFTGKGKLTHPDSGYVEQGEYKDGKLVNGSQTWKNGYSETGEFDADGDLIKGTKTYEDGTIEEGEFEGGALVKNKITKGKITYPDGSIYEGEFKDGNPSGGVHTTTDGVVTENYYGGNNATETTEGGTPVESRKTTLTEEEQDILDNYSIDGTVGEGKAEIKNSEGKTVAYLEGNKLLAKKNIPFLGEQTWEIGEYVDNGDGTYTFKEGKDYKLAMSKASKEDKEVINTFRKAAEDNPQFAKDIINTTAGNETNMSGGDIRTSATTFTEGTETEEYPPVPEYDTPERDNFTGKGRESVAGGEYLGEWKDGKKTKGTITFDDGTTWEGTWDENEDFSEGKITYANGDVYEGSINTEGGGEEGSDYGKPNGGTLTRADGSRVDIDPQGNELDLIVPGDQEAVQASTRVIPNNQAEIDNAGLVDNGDGTYTRTNEDGSTNILVQGLDANGDSVLVVQEEGTDLPEGVVIPRHPDPNHPSNANNQIGEIDPNTGLVWGGDLEDGGWVKPEGTSETAVWNGTEWAEPGVESTVEPEIVETTTAEETGSSGQDTTPQQQSIFNNALKGAGGAADAILQGAGALLDQVGGPAGIISLIMGKKGLEASMKEIKPQAQPQLSPMFMQHLRQTRELAKKGFHPDEAKAIRKGIGQAYQKGLENAVRGSGGQRARFLAQSGVLDAQRSSALLEYAVKDEELQRKNAEGYEKMMLFKENFDINKTATERAEDMERQLKDKEAAAGFTSAAFTSLMNSYSSGKNQAIMNQAMNMFKDGNGMSQLFNSIQNWGNQNNNNDNTGE